MHFVTREDWRTKLISNPILWFFNSWLLEIIEQIVKWTLWLNLFSNLFIKIQDWIDR